MWIHRLWIEFPKWCSPNGKYIKIMILLIWGIPGLVSLASGSICFFLYIHPSLCAILWQRCRSTGHGDVVHQMGLESNQMGGIVCSLNWAFRNSWECRRKKWGRLQERDLLCVCCTLGTFVSFFRCWLFFFRYYFHLLQNSIKGLRWLAIKDSQMYIHIKVKVLSCVQLFQIPLTVACQAPLSMEFSRQTHWSGFPVPSSRNLPNPWIKPGSPAL